MKPTAIVLAAFLALAPTAYLSAASVPLNAQQILTQFNLLTLGDAVSASQQVDGRSFIGGSLSGGVYGARAGQMASSDFAGLTVMKSASGVQVQGQGAVVIGSLSNSTIHQGQAAVLGSAANNVFNGASYVAGASANNKFNRGKLSAPPKAADVAHNNSNFGAVLGDLSTSLSRLGSTGSSVSISDKGEGKRVTFSAVANSQGLAVFDLRGFDKQIFSKSGFAFELNGANTVIFNVDSASLSFASNFLNGSANQLGGKAIWNFYNASSLNISNQFGGTILAPLAKLTHHNSIEGSVLVNQLDQRGKINLHKFTGDITSAVPEAQSYAMLLAGLGLVTWAVRRRPAQERRA